MFRLRLFTGAPPLAPGEALTVTPAPGYTASVTGVIPDWPSATVRSLLIPVAGEWDELCRGLSALAEASRDPGDPASWPFIESLARALVPQARGKCGSCEGTGDHNACGGSGRK